jgi:hypothetical protein
MTSVDLFLSHETGGSDILREPEIAPFRVGKRFVCELVRLPRAFRLRVHRRDGSVLHPEREPLTVLNELKQMMGSLVKTLLRTSLHRRPGTARFSCQPPQ